MARAIILDPAPVLGRSMPPGFVRSGFQESPDDPSYVQVELSVIFMGPDVPAVPEEVVGGGKRRGGGAGLRHRS